MKVVPLEEILQVAAQPERISQPNSETFVTLRLNCGGAVRAKVGAGKTPVAFTGPTGPEGVIAEGDVDNIVDIPHTVKADAIPTGGAA